MKIDGYEIKPLANLSEADLNGANLSEADLFKANMLGADLSGANLFKANLLRANLLRANLSEADLFKANLLGADLLRANLSCANLSFANLLRANLFKANLSGANLSGAELPDRLVLLGESHLGRRRWAWLHEDGSVAEIRCGCRRFASLGDAEAHYLSPDYSGESAGRIDEIKVAISYWRELIAARAERIKDATQ